MSGREEHFHHHRLIDKRSIALGGCKKCHNAFLNSTRIQSIRNCNAKGCTPSGGRRSKSAGIANRDVGVIINNHPAQNATASHIIALHADRAGYLSANHRIGKRHAPICGCHRCNFQNVGRGPIKMVKCGNKAAAAQTIIGDLNNNRITPGAQLHQHPMFSNSRFLRPLLAKRTVPGSFQPGSELHRDRGR